MKKFKTRRGRIPIDPAILAAVGQEHYKSEAMHTKTRNQRHFVVLFIMHINLPFNPPTDRPFETIQNLHFQKCSLVLYTHGDTILTVLVAVLPFKSIQIVLEGPLIHHLEVSKQGFVLAVLPFGKIQTRFCIS